MKHPVKKSTIQVRVDPEIKQQAAEVFEGIGMDISTAVNVFLRQSIRDKGLPFRPQLLDAEGKWDGDQPMPRVDWHGSMADRLLEAEHNPKGPTYRMKD